MADRQFMSKRLAVSKPREKPNPQKPKQRRRSQQSDGSARAVESTEFVEGLIGAISHIECALGYIEKDDDSGPQSPVLQHAIRILWQLHDQIEEEQS